MYEYGYALLHEDATPREIIMRHYDLTKWCKDNANGPYRLLPQYNANGITVTFKLEEDKSRFFDYVNGYYSLFLHNGFPYRVILDI